MSTLQISWLAPFVAIAVVTAACGPADAVDGEPMGDAGESRQCNNEHNGSTACGFEYCRGGEYCVGGSLCRNGCKSAQNCSRGSYCDTRTAGQDGVGTCRPCGSPSAGPIDAGLPKTCVARCEQKALACGLASAAATRTCAEACPALTESKLACLEATPCATIAGGGTVCGIRLEKQGGT
jgi:hypothetical protein